jgi:hypothetical protein
VPNTTFANFVEEGDRLLVTVEANKEDLAFLEETRTQLVTVMEGAKAASVRQDSFKAQFQQATRDLEGFFSQGRELLTRLRNGIRTKYGLRAEKLAEFGMKPRRKAQRAKKQKEPGPVSPPNPTPENNGTLKSNA